MLELLFPHLHLFSHQKWRISFSQTVVSCPIHKLTILLIEVVMCLCGFPLGNDPLLMLALFTWLSCWDVLFIFFRLPGHLARCEKSVTLIFSKAANFLCVFLNISVPPSRACCAAPRHRSLYISWYHDHDPELPLQQPTKTKLQYVLQLLLLLK